MEPTRQRVVKLYTHNKAMLLLLSFLLLLLLLAKKRCARTLFP